METKVWYTSKTVIVAFILAIATALVEALPALKALIPISPDAFWVSIVWSGIAFVLRLITKSPVALTSANAEIKTTAAKTAVIKEAAKAGDVQIIKPGDILGEK